MLQIDGRSDETDIFESGSNNINFLCYLLVQFEFFASNFCNKVNIGTMTPSLKLFRIF